ncbi:hypothetical protein [Salinisphaera sp. LB1]|uniref:hypothetical protein n=1 Tax=Salinisphaera sp. LB1 TaxID=2183911 RepID=UPI000D706FED|nr:hypothetical protein [Salinisphaera sp. LB1]AWN15203.1 hypothetical protein SALB1_0996 [Salinisphaera sp. LB1]
MRRFIARRRTTLAWGFLTAVLALALLVVLWWPHWMARHGAGWTHAPEDAAWVLPAASQKLIKQAFAGTDGHAVVDHGVGIVSRGQLSGPDFANDSQESGHGMPGISVWLSRMLRDRAAGIVSDDTADADYISRLLRQIRAMPKPYRAEITGRAGVFDKQGAPLDDQSEPMVSNRYVAWLAKRAPKALVTEVSIHPRQPDALAAIKRWAKAGVKDVRWWPVAQRINLDGKAAKAVYKVMAAHHMRLDVAVGQLRRPDHDPAWVAPAAVEPALAAGVAVRLRLGGATGGDGQQLMPALFGLLRRHGQAKSKPALTISLAGLLTGNRPNTELEPLLQHPQFFGHLRYGSGYPAIARADAIDLDALAGAGFITRAEVAPLHAIYDVNPLLFALVVMRRVHLPYTTLRFPASVFTAGGD